MNVRCKFLGASSEVTGSKYLLQIEGFTLLVDCGLFQGRKELRMLNRQPFPIEPRRIDAIVITHAHLDHTGYLPSLFRNGCRASFIAPPGQGAEFSRSRRSGCSRRPGINPSPMGMECKGTTIS